MKQFFRNSNRKVNAIVVSIVFFIGHHQIFSQIAINPGISSTQMSNIISGGGLVVSNLTINCDGKAYGGFSNGLTSGLGISKGVILSTGNLAQLPGNNNPDGFNTDLGTTSTDATLQTILGSTELHDVCVMEFDVVPHCNKMNLVFVFGSDEYLNYVNAGFNDGFGFFVSGPKPGGGNYTNQNMAVLPGTSTVVSVNSVNNTSNSSYFINNVPSVYSINWMVLPH